MTGSCIRHVGVLFAAALALTGCSGSSEPDAYGNVEAIEVVVSAEAGGQLTGFDVVEGQTLAAGAAVGTIDATETTLERTQLTAQRDASRSRVSEAEDQVDVLRAQRQVTTSQREAFRAQRAALQAQQEIAQRSYDRTQRLYQQQAATAQQIDQAERELRVLEQQLRAQDEQLAAQEHQLAAQARQIDGAQSQRQTAAQQVAAIDAQIARVGERLRKSAVANPVGGTVLTTFVRRGEVVQPGQPLYKIADLSAVDVRAYVSQPQLARVRLGSPVQVAVDAEGGERTMLDGTVSWVSSQAEFTPTPIQTREERADLVYAIKVRVANERGLLKVGMPVDVSLVATEASR